MVVPSRSAWISSASLSTLKCPDIVGFDTWNWSAISPAAIGPFPSNFRICRRTGCASA